MRLSILYPIPKLFYIIVEPLLKRLFLLVFFNCLKDFIISPGTVESANGKHTIIVIIGIQIGVRVSDSGLHPLPIFIQIPLESLFGVVLGQVLNHDREITGSGILNILLVFNRPVSQAFKHKEHIPEYHHHNAQPHLNHIVAFIFWRRVK